MIKFGLVAVLPLIIENIMSFLLSLQICNVLLDLKLLHPLWYIYHRSFAGECDFQMYRHIEQLYLKFTPPLNNNLVKSTTEVAGSLCGCVHMEKKGRIWKSVIFLRGGGGRGRRRGNTNKKGEGKVYKTASIFEGEAEHNQQNKQATNREKKTNKQDTK